LAPKHGNGRTPNSNFKGQLDDFKLQGKPCGGVIGLSREESGKMKQAILSLGP
jgi:hypothetical protein